MEIKIEKLKDSKIKLIIEIPAKDMSDFFKQTFEKLAASVKISGFRPGKAPRKIVEENIGVARILSESLDAAIQSTYYDALAKEKIMPISSPNVSISKYPNYGLGDEVTDPMVYEAEVEVMPELVLGDFSKIKIKLPEKKTPKKEDIEKVLEYFQKQKSSFKEVDREAKKGDRVEVSFEGYLNRVKMDNMCSKNHPLILGEGSMIPGFEEHIEGMKKAEKKKFSIKFPKDYHAKELAGKDAEFEIEVLDIKEIELPKMDDEFAKAFGHDKIADLNEAVKENLQKEMDQQNKNEIENAAFDKVIPLLKSEIPTSLIDREADRMLGDMQHQLQSQGINFEIYLKSLKKSIDDIKKDFRPQAEKNVKIGLILSKVIDDLKLDRNSQESAKKAIDHIIKTVTKE